MKYISPVEEGAAPPELYDLAVDPGETANLAETRAELSAYYADLARAFASAHRTDTDAVIDEACSSCVGGGTWWLEPDI